MPHDAQKDEAGAPQQPQQLEEQTEGAVPRAELVFFRHHSVERPITYGRRFGVCRAPVVFIEGPSEAVAAYIRDDPLGPFAAGMADFVNANLRGMDSMWLAGFNDWGFEVDKELVAKADWHALPHIISKAEVFVPRLGATREMLRAPPRCLAFSDALRAINKPVWERIYSDLHMFAVGSKLEVVQAVADTFVDFQHFGAVEAQVWVGDEDLRLPSHHDGATSLLHLGLTLSGQRTVRTGTFPMVSTDFQGREENVWNEAAWEGYLQDVKMMPGSAYISSPFCFEHGVRFEAGGGLEPVITLQFRIAYPPVLGSRLNKLHDETMLAVINIVTNALFWCCTHGMLRMPSIRDLCDAQARLERFRRLKARQAAPGRTAAPARTSGR